MSFSALVAGDRPGLVFAAAAGTAGRIPDEIYLQRRGIFQPAAVWCSIRFQFGDPNRMPI